MEAWGVSLSAKINRLEERQEELIKIVTNLTKMIHAVDDKPAIFAPEKGSKKPDNEELKTIEKELQPYIKNQ